MSKQEIEKIIQSAKNALAIEQDDLELFLEHVGIYLEQLELWRAKIKENNFTQENSFQALLKQLSILHQEVTERANSAKDHVSVELAEVSKRAGALKAYVDHLPQRVTMTGKREG